jgi:hypothetical protein
MWVDVQPSTINVTAHNHAAGGIDGSKSPPIAEISLSEKRYLAMYLRAFRNSIGWPSR